MLQGPIYSGHDVYPDVKRIFSSWLSWYQLTLQIISPWNPPATRRFRFTHIVLIWTRPSSCWYADGCLLICTNFGQHFSPMIKSLFVLWMKAWTDHLCPSLTQGLLNLNHFVALCYNALRSAIHPPIKCVCCYLCHIKAGSLHTCNAGIYKSIPQSPVESFTSCHAALSKPIFEECLKATTTPERSSCIRQKFYWWFDSVKGQVTEEMTNIGT